MRLFKVAILVVMAAVVTGTSPSLAQKRADKATAQRLAELMPEALEEWNAGKPRIAWLNGGGSARALYWSKKPGGGSYTISMEARTAGINYKKNLLKDRRRAARRGYTFTKVADTVALVKKSLKKVEIRFWFKNRILVLAKGAVPLETLQEHLKTIDYEKLGGIK